MSFVNYQIVGFSKKQRSVVNRVPIDLNEAHNIFSREWYENGAAHDGTAPGLNVLRRCEHTDEWTFPTPGVNGGLGHP